MVLAAAPPTTKQTPFMDQENSCATNTSNDVFTSEDAPSDVSLGPTSVSPGPAGVNPGPSSVSPGPAGVNPGPAGVNPGPSSVSPGPAGVNPGPAGVNPGPSSVSPGPAGVNPGPAGVNPGPSSVSPGPAGVNPGPAGVNPGPSSVSPGPAGVNPGPAGVNPGPSSVSPGPAGVNPGPAGVNPGPSSVSPGPAGVNPGPAGVNPGPSSVSPGPAGVNPGPAGVSPGPAGVNPGPSPSTQSEKSQRPSFGCGCGNCTFLGYLENGCPNPISTTSSFPYLNTSGLTDEQQQELRSRLSVESQEIMFKFQKLLSKVYESMRQQDISVNRLVTHLLSLGALDPVSKDSQKPLLQTFQQELRNAECIEDVLWVIRDYFSFFNYHVIEHIVHGLGTELDKLELQNYKEEFQQYSKRRIYECPPIYGPISNAGHHALLDLKVDSAYEQFTVKELENFRYRLSKIFRVSSKGVLRLCRVEKGSFQLIFQVPSFVQQEIFPLSSEQESALAAEGVIRLTCGDYQFTAKVCIS